MAEVDFGAFCVADLWDFHPSGCAKETLGGRQFSTVDNSKFSKVSLRHFFDSIAFGIVIASWPERVAAVQ